MFVPRWFLEVSPFTQRRGQCRLPRLTLLLGITTTSRYPLQAPWVFRHRAAPCRSTSQVRGFQSATAAGLAIPSSGSWPVRSPEGPECSLENPCGLTLVRQARSGLGNAPHSPSRNIEAPWPGCDPLHRVYGWVVHVRKCVFVESCVSATKQAQIDCSEKRKPLKFCRCSLERKVGSNP